MGPETLDREEWVLSKTAFQHIQSHFSVQFSVDRFASRVNRQCSRFNSKRWEPEAEQPASAFAHDWHAEWNFCHPPLRLVPQVLAHAKKQKSMDLFGGASVAFAAMVARTVCTHVKHVVFGSVGQAAVSFGTG